jgi:hypothetical protein
MKRVGAVVALLTVVSAGAASAGSLELRAGAFFPRASSNLFVDDGTLYGTQKSDWVGFTGGFEYRGRVSDRVEVGLHMDYYGRELQTSYVDYETESGRDIFQTIQFSTVPVGGTVRFLLAEHDKPVVPYIGAGFDVVFWHYEEFGEFVDFEDFSLPIYSDRFISDGAVPAGHVLAGFRYALNDDVGLSAEGKYLFSGHSDMDKDFRGNEMDVNGPSATVGFYINF